MLIPAGQAELPGGLAPQNLIDQGAGLRTAGTIGASTTIAPGDCCMLIDGVAYQAKSAAALAGLLSTLGSKIAGASADGDLIFWTDRPATKVQLLGGQSKSLGLDSVVYGASQLEIKIQLATNSSSVVTSTGKDVWTLIDQNALLRSLGLRAAYGGDGTGLTVVTALTLISLAGLAGWARGAYVNDTGSPVALEMAFDLGTRAMAVSGTIGRAQVPGRVGIVNATTLRPICGPIDFAVRLVSVSSDGTAVVQID